MMYRLGSTLAVCRLESKTGCTYNTCCTGSDLHWQCADWTVQYMLYWLYSTLAVCRLDSTIHVVPARLYTRSVQTGQYNTCCTGLVLHWKCTDWTVQYMLYWLGSRNFWSGGMFYHLKLRFYIIC